MDGRYKIYEHITLIKKFDVPVSGFVFIYSYELLVFNVVCLFLQFLSISQVFGYYYKVFQENG